MSLMVCTGCEASTWSPEGNGDPAIYCKDCLKKATEASDDAYKAGYQTAMVAAALIVARGDRLLDPSKSSSVDYFLCPLCGIGAVDPKHGCPHQRDRKPPSFEAVQKAIETYLEALGRRHAAVERNKELINTIGHHLARWNEGREGPHPTLMMIKELFKNFPAQESFAQPKTTEQRLTLLEERVGILWEKRK